MSTEVKTVAKNRAEYIEQCKAENTAFLAAHPGRVMIRYVRDRPPIRKRMPYQSMPTWMRMDYRPGDRDPNVQTKGQPNAVFVAINHGVGGITTGWAGTEPGGSDKFNRPMGIRKAIKRAMGEVKAGYMPVLPYRLWEDYGDFRRDAVREFADKAQRNNGQTPQS